MIFLVPIAAVLALLVWLGRGGVSAADRARMVWTVISVACAGAAVFVGLRGGWVFSLGFVALSLYLGRRARIPSVRTRQFDPRPPARETMSLSEAREILGVSSTATTAEIEAAYRRLMRIAHPDHGGSTGLASRINAARDRLLA